MTVPWICKHVHLAHLCHDQCLSPSELNVPNTHLWCYKLWVLFFQIQQAKFYENIMKILRPKPDYFAVGYYGCRVSLLPPGESVGDSDKARVSDPPLAPCSLRLCLSLTRCPGSECCPFPCTLLSPPPLTAPQPPAVFLHIHGGIGWLVRRWARHPRDEVLEGQSSATRQELLHKLSDLGLRAILSLKNMIMVPRELLCL